MNKCKCKSPLTHCIVLIGKVRYWVLPIDEQFQIIAGSNRNTLKLCMKRC
ncbi:hypothetical protein [Vibrio gallaecicus]|nr:hypothetical protein [Vibrio gallaecicus]MDN3617054.1 hypothetical protein [Vibrio gallaecicus]